jgi:hypothetical protein
MGKTIRVVMVAATVALAMGVPTVANAAPNAQVVLVSGGSVKAAPGKSSPKVTCPPGAMAVGGGASSGSPGGVFLLGGGPTDGGRSWVEQVRNTLTTNSTVTVLDMLNGVRDWFDHEGSLSRKEVVAHYQDLITKLLTPAGS